MSTSTESEPIVAEQQEAKKPRLGKIVRWAVRVTSIPIFALLMISLVPALASFGISAKDDQIIALGMSATALGFILAWRWAGIGGAVAAVGVGVMLSEVDGPIFADPFSIAFGLQAILFLISWALNSTLDQAAAPRLAWGKRVAVCLLVLFAIGGALAIYRGPGPTRVPKEKAAFVGLWDNGTGFKLEITAEGRAKITQEKDAKVEPCNTPLTTEGQGEFLINFRTDDVLELTSGVLGSPKVYHIDRRPQPQGKQIKMVLNGSDPYQAKSAMILVKTPTPNPPAPASAAQAQSSDSAAKKPEPPGH
jgi:hypothetical protein